MLRTAKRRDDMKNNKISIIGGGNLGKAIARGLVASSEFKAETIAITRRSEQAIELMVMEEYATTTDNVA